MATTLAPRSWLFAPAHRPERFAKALASSAHAVIIDLEDAVAPSQKSLARDALANWLTPEVRVLVRINGIESPWFADDLRVCNHPGIVGIMLAKAEQAAALAEVAAHTAAHTQLVPLIESAPGLEHCAVLAQQPRVTHLAFGSIDFQVDMGMDVDHDQLRAYRAQLVLASRLARIGGPIDGVFTAIDDPAALRSETHAARREGFSGKLCIHPQQTTVINECFLPSAEQIAWAERVLAAAKQAQGAAVAVDGKMVDKPVMMRAEAILAATLSHAKN